MRIIYSQKDGEIYLSRDKFRELVYPISRTSRNSKLLVKIFFYKNPTGYNWRGNFRSFVDHGFYKNEEKFWNAGKRGIITLKIRPDTKKKDLFSLFAHEFYHWRQSQVVNYSRGRYSEKKANKWADKMTIKNFK